MNTLPRTFLRTLTFGAILGTLASISSVSMADDASAPSQVVVSFADLDLSHSAGVVQLYGRLKGAAETACGALTDGGSGGNLTARAAYKACWQSALAAAVATVNEPALSAVFASRHGMPAPVLVAAVKAR